MGKIKEAVIKISKNPRSVIDYLNALGCFSRFSDRKCVELFWWSKTGKRINLDNPKGFNEKLQWLKLYDHNPQYHIWADKYRVKEKVAELLGQEYVIPTLGVWEDPDEIDFDQLPEQFVLKCNHNCGGGMCICKDKSKLDIHKVKAKLRRELHHDYYKDSREWSYKDIPHKIIAEQFIKDNTISKQSINADGLIDYKFFCFNGVPKFLYTGFANIVNGVKHDQLSFKNFDWTDTPFYRTDHEPFPVELNRPDKLDEMIQIAEKLSAGIPFVRVDLYLINNHILFSEMTFYPGSGYGLFSPPEWETRLGEWIELPDKKV